MSDWWERHERQRIADELQRIRGERTHPIGKVGCSTMLIIFVLGCFYVVPKTIQNYNKDQAARRKMSDFAKLPKEQQEASIKRDVIEIHAEYKDKLDKICIANETRWRHSEVKCSDIKKSFIRNYCPPVHFFKQYISDPEMCTKLKKTSNNW